MDNQRIAEWHSTDVSFEEEGGAPAEPGRPAAPRPAVLARRVRLPSVLGLDSQQARILELIEGMGRRIRSRPLTALALGIGLGFVIGGALSFRAGRLVLAASARRAGREILKQLL